MIKLEIKRQKWFILVWSILIMLLILSSITKFEVMINQDQTVNQLIEQLPRSVQIMFGIIPGIDLTNFVDYMAIVMNYTLVMVAFFGLLSGQQLWIRDTSDQIAEYLYTRPMTRRQILIKKYIAGLIIQMIYYTVVSGTIILSFVVAKQPFNFLIIRLLVGHLAMLLLFYHLGFLLKRLYQKAIGMWILLITYGIAKITDLLDIRIQLTPFKWFDSLVLIHQPLNLYILILIVISVYLLFVLTIKQFNKQELLI